MTSRETLQKVKSVMTGKEALEEIKDFSLAVFDEDGEEEDCIKFGQSEPNLIEPIERDLEILEILKQKLTINENYNEQCSGSTKAIVLCIPDCISIDEDDEYTDDCCPNPEYNKIKEWLEND